MKDLGFANGWRDIPIIVQGCRELKHEIESENIGKCLHRYSCYICKYKYKVDSSD